MKHNYQYPNVPWYVHTVHILWVVLCLGTIVVGAFGGFKEKPNNEKIQKTIPYVAASPAQIREDR